MLQRFIHIVSATGFLTAILLVSLLSFSGCAKKENSGPADSLLAHPLAPPSAEQPHVYHDTATGLYIDSTQLRTPQHKKLLERFTPVQVVNIYNEYQPIRDAKGGDEDSRDAKVQKFLTDHKITKPELVAILEEGDMLGWNDVPQ